MGSDWESDEELRTVWYVLAVSWRGREACIQNVRVEDCGFVVARVRRGNAPMPRKAGRKTEIALVDAIVVFEGWGFGTDSNGIVFSFLVTAAAPLRTDMAAIHA